MINPEQFSQSWGPGLIRTEPDAIAGVNLPDSALRFLTEAGLPKDAGYDISFDRPEDEMPTLPQAFPNGYDFPAEYCRFYPIGVDGAAILCLEEVTGSVYGIDIDGQDIPTRFVNSGLPKLAECLLVNRVFPQDTGGDNEEEAPLIQVIQALKKKMSWIDQEAMQDENNYWPQFFRAALL